MRSSDWFIFAILFVPIFLGITLAIVSCTIFFQNIMTSGVASDIVDDNFETDPDLQTDLKFPGGF